jgi:hypothetical protein
MPGLKPGQETDLPGAPKAEKIPPMPTPLAKGMPAPVSGEQWKPDTSMFKNFGLGENNDVANAPEMGNIPVPAPGGDTGNAPEQPTGPERQGIQSQGTPPPVDVRDEKLPLGATDIQDPSVKGKKSQEQISGNILNPEDELGMRDAQQYGKNQGRGGVDELLSRLNTEDESRFSRAAKLADARGAAFDKYMQGLDKNEQASFISTIVNSLGKILVGGFDLATGPKTASVSQFYKGPEQFDKKAADASEKGRYDAGLQRLNEDEKSIQDAEKNYMDSRMALEELRGKVNGDVFNMASRITDLTKKAYQQGHDVDYITKGMLGVLAQGHNYEMQMEELKGFYRLAEATINGDQAAIVAAMNSKAMVDAAKWQKTNNVEDKKVTTRKIDLNQPAFANSRNAASAATDILGHPSFKNVTESQLIKQVSDVDNAFKAYVANKNPQTLDGYLRALQTWKAATYAALNEGNSGYTIFRGQDNATKKKSLDNLSNILDFYIQGIRRDSVGNQHPLLTKGYAGLQDLSQFVNDEQTKLLQTGKSDFFALPEDHTIGNTVTEGAKVDFKGPSPNGSAQQQPSPSPAPATPTPGATPGATPSAKPTLPPKPATPAPKPTVTPKPKGFIGDANDFLKGFSTPLPTIKELRDKLAAGTITAQEKQKLIELMKK